MKRLIVTGDDFGLSLAVNEAIEQAHRNGILTTTSLMTGSPAAADAVERAKRLPSLKVGLHVCVVRSQPALPPDLIPDLVDQHGMLYENLVIAGIRFFFLPKVRKQLAAEIRAQFEAFHATGLVLDHVNAHNHMHMHPTVLSLILDIGKEYGMRAIRIPYEPTINNNTDNRTKMIIDRIRQFGLLPWLYYMKYRLRKSNIYSNDYIFGFGHSGNMTIDRTLQLLSQIPEGTSELYFHPAVKNLPGERPHHDAEACALELDTLLDSNVKHTLETLGIQITSFSDLAANN